MRGGIIMHQLSKQELININGGAYLRGTLPLPFHMYDALCRLIKKYIQIRINYFKQPL